MEDCSILVASCDHYSDLWDPFFYEFSAHWKDCPFPVYLGSNTQSTNADGVKTILTGSDVDYSSNLLLMLEKIESPWILFWIDDRFLGNDVHTADFVNLLEFAQKNPVGYVKLNASFPYAHQDDVGAGFGRLSKAIDYLACLSICLWKKDLLMRLLKHGETAWEFEKNASARARAVEEDFYALAYSQKKIPLFVDHHILIKSRIRRSQLDYLAKRGYLAGLAKRGMQTPSSFLYENTYILFQHILHAFTDVS